VAKTIIRKVFNSCGGAYYRYLTGIYYRYKVAGEKIITLRGRRSSPDFEKRRVFQKFSGGENHH